MVTIIIAAKEKNDVNHVREGLHINFQAIKGANFQLQSSISATSINAYPVTRFLYERYFLPYNSDEFETNVKFFVTL